MNTTSNAVSETRVEPQPAAARISPWAPLYWSIRRELWEFRSIYIAPLIVAALTIVGFLIGSVHLVAKMRAAEALGPMQLHEAIERPYNFAAMFLMGIVFLISLFYSVEAMQGERRDRSILFWKSLPLSDLTVVLSKMSIPLIILPVIAVVLTIATHMVMLVLNAIILQGSGMSSAMLWDHLSLTSIWMMMAYHMLALHGLWMAPLYSWLLLVSAGARRVAVLWAVLPIAAIGLIEKIAFNTTHFVHWLEYRFGGAPGANAYPGGDMAMREWSHLNLGQLLFNPGLWTGLVVSALLLFAAARVRRSRGPV